MNMTAPIWYTDNKNIRFSTFDNTCQIFRKYRGEAAVSVGYIFWGGTAFQNILSRTKGTP